MAKNLSAEKKKQSVSQERHCFMVYTHDRWFETSHVSVLVKYLLSNGYDGVGWEMGIKAIDKIWIRFFDLPRQNCVEYLR